MVWLQISNMVKEGWDILISYVFYKEKSISCYFAYLHADDAALTLKMIYYESPLSGSR